MLFRVAGLALFLAGAMCAQLDSNTITVSASRNLTQQADQVLFAVSINSGVSTSLSDVISVLEPLGITAANFTGIYSGLAISGVVNPSSPGFTLAWNFQIATSLAKLQDTLSALAALQSTLVQNALQNGKDFILSFFVVKTQVSPQLQQMQTCPVADLIADARSTAQTWASAAGVSIGQVVAISVSNVCSLTIEFGIVRF